MKTKKLLILGTTILAFAAPLTSTAKQLPITEKTSQTADNEISVHTVPSIADIPDTVITEDITPASPFWPRELKLYSKYDKPKEKTVYPRGHYTLYSKWIITKNGTKFSADKIDRALEKINYSPASEIEAVQITAIIAKLKFNARTVDDTLIEDNLTTHTIPDNIMKQTAPARVKKIKKGYEIRFFCYIKADSGFPQEWISLYEAKIHPGICEVKKIKTIWTEKGRYRW